MNETQSLYARLGGYDAIAAVADNAESPLLKLDLAWDGAWDPDGAAMARHLVVKEAE